MAFLSKISFRRLLICTIMGFILTIFFIGIHLLDDTMEGILNAHPIEPIVMIVYENNKSLFFDFMIGMMSLVFAIILMLKTNVTFKRKIVIFLLFWLGTAINGRVLSRVCFKRSYYMAIGQNGLKVYDFSYKNIKWSYIKTIATSSSSILITLINGTQIKILDYKLTHSAEDIYKIIEQYIDHASG